MWSSRPPLPPSPPPAMEMGVLPDADEILRNAGPFGEQLGLGGVAGYCAGVALRTAGTFGLALVGGSFLALQGLQYKGYISVDWHRVEREMVGALDVDGDGTLTDVDARAHWTGFASRWGDITDVLSFGLPSGAGFSLGLAYGVGGPVGRALVLGSAWTAGPTLAAAHAWSNSDEFRRAVAERAPRVAREMSRRLDVGVGAMSVGVGDAAWRASLVAAGNDLPRLRRMERETREAGRRGWFGNRTGASPALDAERVRARLSAINARKREIKAASKR